MKFVIKLRYVWRWQDMHWNWLDYGVYWTFDSWKYQLNSAHDRTNQKSGLNIKARMEILVASTVVWKSRQDPEIGIANPKS